MKNPKRNQLFCIGLMITLVFLTTTSLPRILSPWEPVIPEEPGITSATVSARYSMITIPAGKWLPRRPQEERKTYGEWHGGSSIWGSPTSLTFWATLWKKKQVSPNDFRLLMAARVGVVHFVVLKNSKFGRDNMAKIMTKGIRIGAGEPGSTIGGIVKTFLTAYGLKPERHVILSISAKRTGQRHQRRCYRCGRTGQRLAGCLLQWTWQQPGGSTSSIFRMMLSKKLQALSPVFVKYVIPPGVYPGVDKSVNTFGYPAYMVV